MAWESLYSECDLSERVANIYVLVFIFTDCKLLGKTFYEVKGRPFCEKDYEVIKIVLNTC